MKKRYAIVIEKAPHNYAAYVPDLPGCISTGKTVEEVEHNIHEAIAGHLQVMKDVGEPIPEPSTAVSYVDAPIPA
jgi:predicted RNase H-like HicB family nuclease